MAAKFQRTAQRFKCFGLDLNSPIDQVSPGYYPALTNMRQYTGGVLQVRHGLTLIGTPVAATTPARSVRRLNDPHSGTFQRIVGTGTTLAYGTSSFTQATYNGSNVAFSGNPLTMIQYRPDQSPSSWMYIADSAAMYKIIGQNTQGLTTGTVHQVGVSPLSGTPPTQVLPTNELLQPANGNILNFQSAAGWVGDGTQIVTANITVASRVNTTVTTFLYDTSSFGWCCVVPAAMNTIGPGTLLNFGALGETDTVFEVYPGTSSTTIASIVYDNSPTNTGTCTIQPVGSMREIRRNAVLLLNGTTYVRVTHSTIGPDGSLSFRCSTGASTIGLGQTVQVVSSFRVYTTGTITAGMAITYSHLDFPFTAAAAGTVTGYIQNNTAINLTNYNFGGGNVVNLSDDDYLHLSFKCSDLSKIVQCRIMFNCDVSDTTFAQNFYYRAFTANDLLNAAKGTQTALNAQQTVVQNNTIAHTRITSDRSETNIGDSLDGRIRERIDARRAGDDPNQNLANGNPRSQTGTGDNQWSEIRWKRADLIRVGTDISRGFANITGFRLEIQATASVTVDVTALSVWGTGGPDIGELGAPYLYRQRYRCSTTGACSNWSTSLFEGIQAYRTNIRVFLVPSNQPEVDKIDVQRLGGTLTDWTYLGTTDNSSPNFFDKYGDNDIVANAAVSEGDVNYQLWPIRGVPVKLSGASIGGTALIAPSALPTPMAKGTTILVNGVPTSYRRTINAAQFYYEVADSFTAATGVTIEIPEPVLLNQPLPYLWGPVGGRFFACGDMTNPGTLYWTNGNDADATSEPNWLEITSPSDPLQNGCVFNGRCYVFSSERMFLVDEFGPGQFIYTEVPGAKGLAAPWGLATGERIWFVGKDGIYQSNGGEHISITDQTLRPIFNVEGAAQNSVPVGTPNLGNPASIRLSYYNGYLYFNYADGGGAQQTLIYIMTGEKPGWWYDTYSPGITYHYGEEGSGVNNLLLCGTDGKLYSMGGLTDAGAAIGWSFRIPYFNAGDIRATKMFGDYILYGSASTSVISVLTQGDLGALGPTTTPATFNNGATQTIFDLNSGGGFEAKNMSVFVSASSSTDAPQFYGWEPSYITLPEASVLRATYWDDLGAIEDKFVQGIEIITDTNNIARSIQVQYDRTGVGDTLTVQHNGNVSKAYAFSAPFVAREVRLLPLDGGQTNIWKNFAWKWVWQPEPSAVYHWETQQTANAFDAFQTLKAMYVTLRSSATVTLTITRTDDGTAWTYSIPSTANARQKVYVPLSPIKGKAFIFAFDAGISNPFRLYKDDTVVYIKPWASEQQFSAHNPFGSPHGGGQVRF